MGFVNWLKKAEQQGPYQALLDVWMGLVDRVRAGEGGATPTMKFIRSFGLSGSSIASALKKAQPVIGDGEIDFFWTAWLLRFAPSVGWHPLQHAQNGAASVVHCVRTADRVLVFSNDGELLLEHSPSSTRAPQATLVNEVTFSITKVVAPLKGFEKTSMERVMDRGMERVRAWFGVSGMSAAMIYRLVAKERTQTDRGLAPEQFEDESGAIVTVPDSGEDPSLQFVVLASELDGVLRALSA